MRRVAFDGAALLQVHIAKRRDGVRQEPRLFALRARQDQVGEAFGHLGGNVRDVDRFILFKVPLHQFVDVAVQTVGHCGYSHAVARMPGSKDVSCWSSVTRHREVGHASLPLLHVPFVLTQTVW